MTETKSPMDEIIKKLSEKFGVPEETIREKAGPHLESLGGHIPDDLKDRIPGLLDSPQLAGLAGRFDLGGLLGHGGETPAAQPAAPAAPAATERATGNATVESDEDRDDGDPADPTDESSNDEDRGEAARDEARDDEDALAEADESDDVETDAEAEEETEEDADDEEETETA